VQQPTGVPVPSTVRVNPVNPVNPMTMHQQARLAAATPQPVQSVPRPEHVGASIARTPAVATREPARETPSATAPSPARTSGPTPLSVRRRVSPPPSAPVASIPARVVVIDPCAGLRNRPVSHPLVGRPGTASSDYADVIAAVAKSLKTGRAHGTLPVVSADDRPGSSAKLDLVLDEIARTAGPHVANMDVTLSSGTPTSQELDAWYQWNTRKLASYGLIPYGPSAGQHSETVRPAGTVLDVKAFSDSLLAAFLHESTKLISRSPSTQSPAGRSR